MEATSLWDTLRAEINQPDEGRRGLKAWLREKLELAQYRPEAAPGVITSRLTGRDGGDLPGLAAPCLVVPSNATARIQEMHILLGQMLCAALEIELGLVAE